MQQTPPDDQSAVLGRLWAELRANKAQAEERHPAGLARHQRATPFKTESATQTGDDVPKSNIDRGGWLNAS